jgi:FAD/FMN-containing dehydrogenase
VIQATQAIERAQGGNTTPRGDSMIKVAGLDGGPVTLVGHHLDDLRSRVAGPLLQAGDGGWDESVRIWNGMVAKLPALVVRPTSARDVAAALGFAREHGLSLGVKGGGHNIAGTAIADGGLVLDLSRMREIGVDPRARLVRVGPGCLLGDVDRATQAHGLATALGLISDTGVAGLTLGGGFGYLTRRFGWAVDNLTEVEIVTAAGDIRTASLDQNADLFWALRGGGGNFGVVTRFTFRLHEVGPTVTGGLIVWPSDRAAEVLGAFRDLTESAPRELTAAVFVSLGPPAPFLPERWHGKPIVGMFLCHSGADPRADLAAVRALGDPLADLIGEMAYADLQSMFDADLPGGLHYYEKSEFLSALSDDFLDAFRTAAEDVAWPVAESVVFHLGGALNERAADDGAVGNRDARYVNWFTAGWPPGTRGDERPAWVRKAWESIRPFSTGGNYVNFQMADDSRVTAAAYGKNYRRLRHLKAEYDPENLFRLNRNIPPADRP